MPASNELAQQTLGIPESVTAFFSISDPNFSEVESERWVSQFDGMSGVEETSHIGYPLAIADTVVTKFGISFMLDSASDYSTPTTPPAIVSWAIDNATNINDPSGRPDPVSLLILEGVERNIQLQMYSGEIVIRGKEIPVPNDTEVTIEVEIGWSSSYEGYVKLLMDGDVIDILTGRNWFLDEEVPMLEIGLKRAHVNDSAAKVSYNKVTYSIDNTATIPITFESNKYSPATMVIRGVQRWVKVNHTAPDEI